MTQFIYLCCRRALWQKTYCFFLTFFWDHCHFIIIIIIFCIPIHHSLHFCWLRNYFSSWTQIPFLLMPMHLYQALVTTVLQINEQIWFSYATAKGKPRCFVSTEIVIPFSLQQNKLISWNFPFLCLSIYIGFYKVYYTVWSASF